MQTPIAPHDIEHLRREAKKLSREIGITHTQALDLEAGKHGYRNWALMQHALATAPARFPVFSRTTAEMRGNLGVSSCLLPSVGSRDKRQELTPGLPRD